MVGGHQWCMLARDDWSCAGDRYTRMLNSTPRYNSTLSFDRWPAETRVYAEGNSILAQLLYTVLCESQAEIWKIDGTASNSIIAFSQSGASMFLLDNHDFWNYNTSRSMALLKDIGFEPTVIVFGDFNGGGEKFSKTRRGNIFKNQFNRSLSVSVPGRFPSTCCADFSNCREVGCIHGCFPGPIIRDAEDLVRAILHL